GARADLRRGRRGDTLDGQQRRGGVDGLVDGAEDAGQLVADGQHVEGTEEGRRGGGQATRGARRGAAGGDARRRVDQLGDVGQVEAGQGVDRQVEAVQRLRQGRGQLLEGGVHRDGRGRRRTGDGPDRRVHHAADRAQRGLEIRGN